MASGAKKLIPSDPEKVMVIRKVTPDIITCSTPFLRFGRIKIGGRGTIVRLATGSLAVFSPVALTETVKKESDSLGTVKYLIAPDVEHHIFLESWHKAYPEAKVIGPDSLPEARDKQGYFKLPSEVWNVFTKTKAKTGLSISEEFDKEFDMEYVYSHVNKELVFNHKPSRTLIEADLMFNLPAYEQMSKSGQSPESGILTKIWTSLNHTRGEAMGQRRFIWYATSSGDRPAFNESISKINAWDFDRIIPCPGDVIESGAKGIFQKVFAWHLAAANKAK